MIEFFALMGGFWFFLLVLCVLCIGIFSTEYDNLIGAIATITILLVGLYILGVPVFSAIWANPFLIFICLLAYVVIGMGYSIFIRYPNFIKDSKYRIIDAWHAWQNSYPDSTTTKEEFIESKTKINYTSYRPEDNINRITTWAIMWPWGLLWDLTHRPMRWLYDNMYKLSATALKSVYERTMKKVLEDLK